MKLLKYIFLLIPFLSQAQEGVGHFGKVNIGNGKVVPTQRLYVNGASYLNGTLQLPIFTNGFLTVNGSGVVGVTAGTITPTPGANGTILTSNGTVASWNLATNANIATAAAIAITKLAAGTANTVFTTNGTTNSFQSITNAFISSSAAIAVTKLANGAAYTVIQTDGTTIAYSKLLDQHISSNAFLSPGKIGDQPGLINSTEYNSLNGMTGLPIQSQLYQRINKDSLRLTFSSGLLGIQGSTWGGVTSIINLDLRYLTSSSLIPYSNITGGTANAITYYNGSGVLSAGNANFVHNGTKTGLGTSTLDSTFNLVGGSRHVGNSRQLGKATFIAPNGDPNNTAIEISLGRLTLNNNENASIAFGNNLLASVEGGGIYHGISSPSSLALLLGGAASSYTSIYTNNTHRFRSGGLVQQMQIDATGVNITNALSANAIKMWRNGVNSTTRNISVGSGFGSITSGYQNVALGDTAMLALTSGYSNVAVGHYSMWLNQSGFQNVAIGEAAMRVSTSGENNVAVGYQSLLNNTGNTNTSVGALTLSAAGTNNNTALGYSAGTNNLGANNFFIGANAGNQVSGTRSGNGFIGGFVGNTVSTSNGLYLSNGIGTRMQSFDAAGITTFHGYSTGYPKLTSGVMSTVTGIPYSDITGGPASAIAVYNGSGVLTGGNTLTWDGTRMGIGSSGSLGVGVYISQPMGANTLGQGLYINSPANDAITSDIRLIEANANTSSGTNVLNVSNFRASKGTFAGSVTNNYGFHADNTLTSAANNYGFYSDIATAANRWNFYANGSAPNYYGGAIGVGVNVPTTTNGGVDIASGGQGLIVGADVGATSRTNSTTKTGIIGSPSYLNAQPPMTIIGSTQSAANNTVNIGGNVSSQNAATAVNIITAPINTLTGTTRLSINSVGNLGLPTPLTGVSLNIDKSITGSVGSMSISNTGQIQSDVTSSGSYYATTSSTQAASFTLNNIYHYSAFQGTFGAGSTVTNQMGFRVASSLTGATNNYGYYGDIAAAAGRWNLFMNGTAQNYIAGNIGIGSGKTTPTYAVDVNGTVAANRFLNQGSAPTIAAGTGAGTAPTVSITAGSTDNWFQVNVTTGTTPTALAVVATITLNGGAYSTLSPGGCTPSNAATGLLAGAYFTNTTNTLVINANSGALLPATAYVWDCWKGGK